MQAFLVYGWLGGAAYLTLVVVTLVSAFAAVRMPHRGNLLIAAYAVFVGEAVEGLSSTPIIGATSFSCSA